MNSKKLGKKSAFLRFIDRVEYVGNKLPHPFFIFCILAIIVVTLSAIFAGTSVTYVASSTDGSGLQDTTVSIVNLLSKSYWQGITKNLASIYVSFAPLGIVMVMMLAIGFAQDTGFFDAFMKKTLLGLSPAAVTFVLAIVCICANMASSAGVVFAATIGAAIFSSLGRNPIIGAVFGYAAAHGGFGANLLLTADDVLLSGITQSAVMGMSIDAPINPMFNYFFMFVATFFIAGAATFVTEKVLPKTCKYGGISMALDQRVTEEENKGLRSAFITFIVFIVIMLILTIPENAFFRADDGSLIPSSPLTSSIVTILFVLFVSLGTAYGIGSGTIKKQGDIPRLMGQGLSGSITFFVIAFPSALFIQFFNDSKLANIISVKGAEFLQSMNFDGIPLAISFVILSGICNLFMTSSSAKWLILAPIFVPMFAIMDFSPAFTTLCFRIGDSIANPIAPINFFLPIVLGIMNQYSRKEDPEIGMGSLISMTLPYSIAYACVLIPLLIIWMVFNIAIGPGATITM